MLPYLKKELPLIILFIFITAYATYFSAFTILRNEKMYAHYFDLGIMHQTVYNTYKGLQTGDFGRILELTDPHGTSNQVKRMSIHNDIFLALLAPFYFIHAGPETLLVIQALVAAFGAMFVFLIAERVFEGVKVGRLKGSMVGSWMGLLFGMSYLLYPPLQKAVVYEFHAVTLAPTFFLGMYYLWMRKQYWWSGVFAVLAILTKEQVGLFVALFGMYVVVGKLKSWKVEKVRNIIPNLFENLWREMLKQVQHDIKIRNKNTLFALSLIGISIIWVALSMFAIIPSSRGGGHFAAHYYDYLKAKPWLVFPVLFRAETFTYLAQILGPVGFLSLLSPLHLAIALPDFAIILLSDNANMRNIYFHYDAVLAAWVFIAAIYGAKKVVSGKWWVVGSGSITSFRMTIAIVIGSALIATCTMSSLPWGRLADMYPWRAMPAMTDDMQLWRKLLADDSIRVSATGHLAPHFTSRRYFYDFSKNYPHAEYILIDTHEVRYGYLKKFTVGPYDQLRTDPMYSKIYDKDGLQVFRRL